MKETLYSIGVLFILAGILFGLNQIKPLGAQRDDVQYWKDAASTSLDNNLIEDRYNTLASNYQSKLTITIAGAISGIVTGVFFLALGTIIQLLQKIVHKKEDSSNEIPGLSAETTVA